MAAQIQRTFPEAVVELVPGGRGDFIVTRDAITLWHKRQMNDEFPSPELILEQLSATESPSR